ncbi:hypothetical protein I79_017441 [Cricetulus griseus]|uniref:Uncharacterized protein n=1 Tax=Cricetulus griseus TaxID=10029 RepID=G3I218_CRIGR|nr:hypothetical protein I79_017441 [Cricetulus griseus]
MSKVSYLKDTVTDRYRPSTEYVVVLASPALRLLPTSCYDKYFCQKLPEPHSHVCALLQLSARVRPK